MIYIKTKIKRMEDTRAFVKSNVDVFERGNRSKI